MKFLPHATLTAFGLCALFASPACSDDHFENHSPISPDAQTSIPPDAQIAIPQDAQTVSVCNETDTVALRRFWNGNDLEPAQRDHFYTTNEDAVAGTGFAFDYVDEGVEARVRRESSTDTLPLRRFWNGVLFDHFYTTNEDAVAGSGFLIDYVDEGIEGHIYPEYQDGLVALYEYWDVTHADHFYTVMYTDEGVGFLIDYSYVGVSGYVCP